MQPSDIIVRMWIVVSEYSVYSMHIQHTQCAYWFIVQVLMLSTHAAILLIISVQVSCSGAETCASHSIAWPCGEDHQARYRWHCVSAPTSLSPISYCNCMVTSVYCFLLIIDCWFVYWLLTVGLLTDYWLFVCLLIINSSFVYWFLTVGLFTDCWLIMDSLCVYWL